MNVRRRLTGLDVYYGWVVVVACFLSATATFGTMYSFSVFFGHIAAEFQQTTANTSVIFSLQSIVTYGGAAVVGLYADRLGVRRLLVVAIALVGAGLLGASQLPSLLGVTVSYGVVTAAGFAIVIPITFATVPRWFDRRRGLANGLATSGTGVGLVLAPPLANVLVDAVGWRDAYLGFTVIVVATLGLATLVLADGPGALDVDTSHEFAGEDAGSERSEWDDLVGEVRGIAGSSAFLLVFTAFLAVYVPVYVVLVYVVEFTESIGVGREAGVLAISAVGVVSILGRNVAGVASDRFGRAQIAAACAAVVGASTVGLALGPPTWLVLALAVGFGLGYGGLSPLIAPLLAELFGNANVYALFGATAIAWGVAGSLGPYLSGVGYDALGSFGPVFGVAGAFGLFAAVIFLVSDRIDAPAAD